MVGETLLSSFTFHFLWFINGEMMVGALAAFVDHEGTPGWKPCVAGPWQHWCHHTLLPDPPLYFFS